MSASYLSHARTALSTVIEASDMLDEAQKRLLRTESFVRPPKNPSWGDICTNAAILLKSYKNISENTIRGEFLNGFQRFAGIDQVDMAENGYINLKYSTAFWQNGLLDIIAEGEKYGLENTIWRDQELSIEIPTAVIDLKSARTKANSDCLSALATLTKSRIIETTLPVEAPLGLPLETAYAKCTERRTRFALIANPPAFVDAFSPILAIDKAYDNPVFCIPYALGQIEKLLDRTVVEKNAVVDMSLLSLETEINLSKLLCGWPLAVEKAFRKADVFYLIAFLQDVSLLFFRLADERRPVSSDYLTAHQTQQPRLQLLRAAQTILSRGQYVLDLHSIEERDQ